MIKIILNTLYIFISVNIINLAIPISKLTEHGIIYITLMICSIYYLIIWLNNRKKEFNKLYVICEKLINNAKTENDINNIKQYNMKKLSSYGFSREMFGKEDSLNNLLSLKEETIKQNNYGK